MAILPSSADPITIRNLSNACKTSELAWLRTIHAMYIAKAALPMLSMIRSMSEEKKMYLCLMEAWFFLENIVVSLLLSIMLSPIKVRRGRAAGRKTGIFRCWLHASGK